MEIIGSRKLSDLIKATAGKLVGLRIKLRLIWIQMPHSSIVPT